MKLSADILFFHILPRLPAKSLCRFTCVSKQWYSFIISPGLRKMNLHHVINDDHQNHQKLLFLPVARPWVFRTIDCESPKDGLTASRPFPFEVGLKQKISIVTSLHGMVCVALTKPKRGMYYDYYDLILWNPVTGDYKKLSRPGSNEYCYRINCRDEFGLYYSSSEDDYKLVFVSKLLNVYIYSLKSDSWTKFDSSVFLNEDPSFHDYLIKFEELLSPESNSIMTFDTKNEKLRDMATPPLENQRTDCMGYMVIRGCIHFFVAIINSIGRYDTIELWKCEYGSWKKLVNSSRKERVCRFDRYLHSMENGNWVMHSRSEENLYVLDTKKHTKHIICPISIAFSPHLRYMETIVSPNQYTK